MKRTEQEKQKQLVLERMKKVRDEDTINLRDKIGKELKRIDGDLEKFDNQIKEIQRKMLGFSYGKAFLLKILSNKEQPNVENKN